MEIIYSKIISINLKPSDIVKVYPNPNNGLFNVITNGITKKLDILIVDAGGKQIYHRQFSNVSSAPVRLPEIKAVYYVKINADDVITNKTVVVQ